LRPPRRRRAFDLMERWQVRNAFFPPTALKMMRAVPREIEFVDELPMTPTGKVRRDDLRQQEEARA
jgi:acyl-coenzyme A synthetase/AMP-(fatty) acid ligase